MSTPESGVPWTSGEVDDFTQEIIDDRTEAAQLVGGMTAEELAADPALTGAFVSRSSVPPAPSLLVEQQLIIGANIIPTPTQVATGPAWPLMWQGVVQADGTLDWITDQIDALVSQDTQGRSVRIIGAVGGIRQGFYTRAEYIAAWRAVSDYARTKNVSIYGVLGGTWRDYGAGCAVAAYPTAADLDDLAAVAVALQEMGNVVAIDVQQEWDGDYPAGGDRASMQPIVVDILTEVKAAGCALPLTASNPIFDTASWAVNFEGFGSVAGTELYDFVDRHVYGGPTYVPAPTHPTQMYSFIGTRPIVIGESGLPMTATSGERTAHVEAIRDLLRGGRIVGFYYWAAGDQGTTDAHKYGLYSGTPGGALTARSDIAEPFLSLPRRRTGTAMSKYKNSVQSISAGSVINVPFTSTDFDWGGLGNGDTTVFFVIPAGMGGLYRITCCISITAGATGGAFDFNLADAVTSEVVCQVTDNFAASEASSFSSTRVSYLPDGFQGYAYIYTTQPLDLRANRTLTYVEIERIGDF